MHRLTAAQTRGGHTLEETACGREGSALRSLREGRPLARKLSSTHSRAHEVCKLRVIKQVFEETRVSSLDVYHVEEHCGLALVGPPQWGKTGREARERLVAAGFPKGSLGRDF